MPTFRVWTLVVRSFEWDIDLGVAARHGNFKRGDDNVEIFPRKPPRRVPQNNDGNVPANKVLLVTYVFVGRHDQFEACHFRNSRSSPF